MGLIGVLLEPTNSGIFGWALGSTRTHTFSPFHVMFDEPPDASFGCVLLNNFFSCAALCECMLKNLNVQRGRDDICTTVPSSPPGHVCFHVNFLWLY